MRGTLPPAVLHDANPLLREANESGFARYKALHAKPRHHGHRKTVSGCARNLQPGSSQQSYLLLPYGQESPIRGALPPAVLHDAKPLLREAD